MNLRKSARQSRALFLFVVGATQAANSSNELGEPLETAVQVWDLQVQLFGVALLGYRYLQRATNASAKVQTSY
jgi:hypothetical protein